MFALVLLGLLTILIGVTYLIVHLVKKVKDRERQLSKKILFSLFIGGLVLLIFGASFMDPENTTNLNKEIAKNEKLTTKVKTLTIEIDKLRAKNDQYEKTNKELTKKANDFEAQYQTLNAEKVKHTEETTTLNNKISDLTSENEGLKAQLNDLNEQLASVPDDTTTITPNSDDYERFENCTDLRGTYPNGVPDGHPAYVPSMDRDKDGYACE